MEPTFEFDAPLWLHSSGSWVMLTVPEDESDEIRNIAPDLGGFGSVRVRVTIGSTVWTTSVFPQKNQGPYVLPIKKDVRKREGIDAGDTASISLTLLFG